MSRRFDVLRVPLLRQQRDGEDNVKPIEPITDQQWTTLRRLNIAGAIVHGVSFVGVLAIAIWAQVAGFASLVPGILSWDMGATFINGTYITESGNVTAITSTAVGPYPLIWVDVGFPLVTAIFHALIAFSPAVWGYYRKNLEMHRSNPLRWTEYSITASLMTWIIAQLVGITNIFLLIAVAVIGNVVLQQMGALMETMNARRSKGRVHWAPTIIGWVIFAGQWAAILTYFIVSATQDPPAFVWVIVFALLGIYMVFGLVQLAHYAGWPRWLSSSYAVEIAYIVLSLTSKLVLTWTLVPALIRAHLTGV